MITDSWINPVFKGLALRGTDDDQVSSGVPVQRVGDMARDESKKFEWLPNQ